MIRCHKSARIDMKNVRNRSSIHYKDLEEDIILPNVYATNMYQEFHQLQTHKGIEYEEKRDTASRPLLHHTRVHYSFRIHASVEKALLSVESFSM